MPGSGIIVMWSGNLNQIPNGWLLCDGTFGTPDLRDKFIKGTSTGVDPGGVGGNSDHFHSYTGLGHTHTVEAGGGIAAGPDASTELTEEVTVGFTNVISNEPEFFKLAFVMKA